MFKFYGPASHRPPLKSITGDNLNRVLAQLRQFIVIKIESCEFREVCSRPQGLRYYDLVGLVSLGLDPLEFYQALAFSNFRLVRELAS